MARGGEGRGAGMTVSVEAAGGATSRMAVAGGAGRWRMAVPTAKPRSKTKMARVITIGTAAAMASCRGGNFSTTNRRSRLAVSSVRMAPSALPTRPAASMGRAWARVGRQWGRVSRH